MCVKIVKSKGEFSYDLNKPLEDQLNGSKEILINYESNDPAIEKFLNEVERIYQNGVFCNLNIKVKHNNMLDGAKVKRKSKFLEKQLKINEVIKKLSLCFSESDRKLEEISELCLGKNKNG